MKTLNYAITGFVISILLSSCGYVNKDVPNEQLEALKQEITELDKKCESLKAEKLSLETSISKKDALIKSYYNQIDEAKGNCR
jgi:peptidoglycan hydrolase CwlO-like protein